MTTCKIHKHIWASAYGLCEECIRRVAEILLNPGEIESRVIDTFVFDDPPSERIEALIDYLNRY